MKFLKKDVVIVLIVLALLVAIILSGINYIIQSDEQSDAKDRSSQSNLIPNFKRIKINSDYETKRSYNNLDTHRINFDELFISHITPTGWSVDSGYEIGYYYDDIEFNLCDISLYKIETDGDIDVKDMAISYAMHDNSLKSFGHSSIYNINWYIYTDDSDYNVYVHHYAKVGDSYYYLLYRYYTAEDIPDIKSSDLSICKDGYKNFISNVRAKK